MTMQFYRAFEDRYRGSRDLIKGRLSAYQPFLGVLLAAYPAAAAIDLGCGRGEWLELLSEQGFRARGVDLDSGMLAACLERGLDATNADALTALSAMPDESVAVVSAFHLVEHVPFDTVQAIISQARRVLVPGGLMILETPNPENIVVGSSDFYTDPSHLRPIPPNLLGFAAEHGGFARHIIMRLQEDPGLHDDPQLNLLTVLEGASPDYSVVAQKEAAPELLAEFDALFSAVYGLDMKTLARRQADQAATRHAEIHHALGGLADRISADRVATVAENRDLQSAQQGLHEAYTQVDAALKALQAQEAELEAQHVQLQLGHDELKGASARTEEKISGQLSDLSEATARQSQVIDAIREQIGMLVAADTRTTSHLNVILTRLDTIGAEMAHVHQATSNDELRWAAVQAQEFGRRATDAGIQALDVRLDGIEAIRQQMQDGDPRLEAFIGQVNTLITQQAHSITALKQSRSWRITAPMRSAGEFVRRMRASTVGLRASSKRTAIALLRRSVQATLRRPALKRVARVILMRLPSLQSRLRVVLYRHDPDAPHMRPQQITEPPPLPGAELPVRTARIYRELKQLQQAKGKN